MSAEVLIQFFVALMVILALLALLPNMLRWFQNHPRFQGLRRPTNRLDVIEGKMIDTKRRLVLVRRDNKEHLLLIGGENDLVIERGIDADDQPDDTSLAASQKNRPTSS